MQGLSSESLSTYLKTNLKDGYNAICGSLIAFAVLHQEKQYPSGVHLDKQLFCSRCEKPNIQLCLTKCAEMRLGHEACIKDVSSEKCEDTDTDGCGGGKHIVAPEPSVLAAYKRIKIPCTFNAECKAKISFYQIMVHLKEHIEIDQLNKKYSKVPIIKEIIKKFELLEDIKKLTEAVSQKDNSIKKNEAQTERLSSLVRQTQKCFAERMQQQLTATEPQATATELQEKIKNQAVILKAQQAVIAELQEKEIKQDKTIKEYDLRLQVFETASYDGTLMWKIKGYKRRKAEAAGSASSFGFYSQAFYTLRHGYRMCGRVYLNGDGQGSGSYLSFFFVLLRGEYDALLRWPFRQRVSLMLMDQSGKGQHVQETFKADPSSSSFQKPQSETNIAAGFPMFISHQVIGTSDSPYLIDDTIFLKIVVDLTNLANSGGD